jgi:hypothetical protein
MVAATIQPEGAGRVEDTVNLLAHSARKLVECAAGLLHWTPERVCSEARAPLTLSGGGRMRWRCSRTRTVGWGLDALAAAGTIAALVLLFRLL